MRGITKDYDGWNSVKKIINSLQEIPYFYEREAWWCSIGINVGVEIDGKNEKYERPVVILKRINKETVFIVPLTKKQRDEKTHFPIYINGIISFAKMTQCKTISTKRLLRKIGTINKKDFYQLKDLVLRALI